MNQDGKIVWMRHEAVASQENGKLWERCHRFATLQERSTTTGDSSDSTLPHPSYHCLLGQHRTRKKQLIDTEDAIDDDDRYHCRLPHHLINTS